MSEKWLAFNELLTRKEIELIVRLQGACELCDDKKTYRLCKLALQDDPDDELEARGAIEICKKLIRRDAPKEEDET